MPLPTYLYPQTTVLTGPTRHNTVVATVAAGSAADNSAIITHQMGLSAGEITQGFPHLTIVPQDGSEFTSLWFEASENPNYTVLAKNTVAQGGTVKVFVERPHSITK